MRKPFSLDPIWNENPAAALARLPSLKQLHLNTLAEVPPDRAIDLSSLGLSSDFCTLIVDRPATNLPAALPELRTLFIDGSMLENLKPIGRYHALEHLRASHLRVGRLAPLAACEKLEKIDVRGAPVRDIRTLARMQHLHEITIAETAVDDIVPLSHLPRVNVGITALTIGAANTPVSSLRGWNPACPLWRLDLSGNRVTDISPLAGSGMLSRLNLKGTPIADLTGLASFPWLSGLIISGTQVASLDEVLRNPSLLMSWWVETCRAERKRRSSRPLSPGRGRTNRNISK